MGRWSFTTRARLWPLRPSRSDRHSGSRAPCWGPRIGESAPNQDFVSVYLDDGRRVVAVANRADGREDAHGVIWKPGETRPIQLERYEIRTDYAGEPAPSETMGWTFEGGGEAIEVEGEVVGFMPLRVGKNR